MTQQRSDRTERRQSPRGCGDVPERPAVGRFVGPVRAAGGDRRSICPAGWPTRLAAGQLDVAMIPSIEYARGSGYAIISDACIACDGAVRSVKLYSRVPIERLRTLGAGRGLADQCRAGADSAEGAIWRLARLPAAADRRLARRRAGRRGDVDRRPGHAADRRPASSSSGTWARSGGGGRACRLCSPCGSPGRGSICRALARLLAAARDDGVTRLEEIARQAAPAIGVPEADCLSYLRDHLTFHLGPRQRQGLERFYALAGRHGLAPAGVKLVFYVRA